MLCSIQVVKIVESDDETGSVAIGAPRPPRFERLERRPPDTLTSSSSERAERLRDGSSLADAGTAYALLGATKSPISTFSHPSRCWSLEGCQSRTEATSTICPL
jgi:hypothetical protein